MIRRLLAAFVAAFVCTGAAMAQTVIVPTPFINGGGIARGPILGPDGSESAPTYSWSGSTGTGFYRISSGNIGVSAAGTTQWAFLGNELRGRSIGQIEFSSTTSATGTPDVIALRDGAGIFALQNGNNNQSLRLYSHYTDASNFDGGFIQTASDGLHIGWRTLGTGTARGTFIGNQSADWWTWDTSGNFKAVTDNTYDIGASGATRPKNYFGAGYVQTGTGALLNNVAVGNTGTGSVNVRFVSPATSVAQFTNDGGTGLSRLVLGTNDNTVTGVSFVLNGSGNVDVQSGDGTSANRAVRASSFTTFSGGTYSSTDATGTVISNGSQSVSAAAIISIGTSATKGLLVMESDEDNDACVYMLRGGAAPTEISDPSSACTNTKDSATQINIYWDGVSAYKLQNTRASTRTIRLVRLGV